jgi:NAD(P)H-quinone oxidoreductase subunit 5
VAARTGEYAALSALFIAGVSLLILVWKGAGDSPLLGFAGIGFSARIDVLSVTMLLLVTFIGWVVVRYARTYLDGEARQTTFTKWLMATLAAIVLMVQSGNIVQFSGAWIATSLALHQLLLFYQDASRHSGRLTRNLLLHAWATWHSLPPQLCSSQHIARHKYQRY